MGVDVKILLPAAVKFHDVVTLIGVLSGLPFKREPRYGWVDFTGDRPVGKSTTIPEMAQIDVRFNDGDHRSYFHFESDEGPEWRSMLPRSTGFWCAVAKRLVTFFGGKVLYRDCGDGWDLEVDPKPVKFLYHTDGDDFRDFHDAMAREAPLTAEDIEEGKRMSACDRP